MNDDGVEAFISRVSQGYSVTPGYAWHPASGFYERYLASLPRGSPALDTEAFCSAMCRLSGITWEACPMGEFYRVHKAELRACLAGGRPLPGVRLLQLSC
jgi:hypothetical protein